MRPDTTSVASHLVDSSAIPRLAVFYAELKWIAAPAVERTKRSDELGWPTSLFVKST